jgi:hypothetical protein
VGEVVETADKFRERYNAERDPVKRAKMAEAYWAKQSKKG